MTYTLETETDSFELDPESGLLVVSRELDREDREFYDLTIRQVGSANSVIIEGWTKRTFPGCVNMGWKKL